MTAPRTYLALSLATLMLLGFAGCDDRRGRDPVALNEGVGTADAAPVADPCPDIEYEEEGTIAVPGGNVWYGIYGKGTRPPLLVVHGGPGATHYYLMPSLKEYADANDRPIIFYDQLGCGRSERPSDPTLWTVDRFTEELAAVVAHLELDAFHLWGHSWGTQLASHYAAGRPAGLLSLTLASPVVDIPAYRQDLRDLLARQPQEVQDGVNDNEPGSEEYGEALNAFYGAHLVALDPWPPCWDKSLSDRQFGSESYLTTIGTDELNYTGNLKDRDDSPLLAEVRVPIWYNCGADDIAVPARCEEYATEVPGSASTIYANSSHAYFDEERLRYLADLARFLDANDP